MNSFKQVTASPGGNGSRLRASQVARKRVSLLYALTFLVSSASHSTSANPAPDFSLPSEWRITRVVDAPWAAKAAAREMPNTPVGRRVLFTADFIDGPGLLRCDHANIKKTSYPAQSLFQGALPESSANATEALGISHLPLAGIALTCSTGLFEFHFVDADTLLTALGNQIFTLSRSGGTQAAETSPEGRIQRFLERHFSGDMGFSPQRMKAQSGWLSMSLDRAVTDYFAKPASQDEVPAVGGDPFTDSQTYPTRFSVGQAKISGNRAEIPVQFADAVSDRTVVYLLQFESDNWQLDDVRFDNDEKLSNLLK